MTSEINVKTMTSTHIDLYNERRPLLEERIAALAEDARNQAKDYTKQEITQHLQGIATIVAPKQVEIPDMRATIDVFVEAYVTTTVDNSLEKQQLDRLWAAATADRTMAMKINWHLGNADVQLEALKNALSAKNPANALRWGADTVAVAERVADLLAPIAEAVDRPEDPYDIRKASERLARSAVQRLAQLPRFLLSNGLGGAGKAERLYEAAAAQEILGMVREAYGDLEGADTIRIGVGYI